MPNNQNWIEWMERRSGREREKRTHIHKIQHRTKQNVGARKRNRNTLLIRVTMIVATMHDIDITPYYYINISTCRFLNNITFSSPIFFSHLSVSCFTLILLSFHFRLCVFFLLIFKCLTVVRFYEDLLTETNRPTDFRSFVWRQTMLRPLRVYINNIVRVRVCVWYSHNCASLLR